MKKNLLTLLFLTGTSSMMFAQSRVALPNTNNQAAQAMQQNFTSFKSSMLTCDSVTNFLPTYSPTIYTSSNGGFVSGQNGYGDIAKADQFAIVTPNSTVDGIIYLTGAAASSGTSQTFDASIWDDDGAAGAPNTVLGAQAVSYDTIVANQTALLPTYVDFSPDITVSGTIYGGVSFGYTAGDTIALISSLDGEAAVNTAWEQFSTLDWYAFDNASSWGLVLAHAVYLVVCTPLGVHQVLSPSGEIAVVPNPSATGNFTIVVPNYNLNESIKISLFDAKGALVYNSTLTASASYTYQLSIPNAEKGIYSLQIETSQSVKTKKLVIN